MSKYIDRVQTSYSKAIAAIEELHREARLDVDTARAEYERLKAHSLQQDEQIAALEVQVRDLVTQIKLNAAESLSDKK